jgi:hypothetical protein
MVAFNKYFCAAKDLAEKRHDFSLDVFAVVLTNRAPVVATDQFLADISEIAAGNGYLAGGKVLANQSSSQSGGVYKAVLGDPPVWQASGGSMAAFRYAVLINQSIGGSPLSPATSRVIGYWDYGSSITLPSGESFQVDLDQVNGVIQIQ